MGICNGFQIYVNQDYYRLLHNTNHKFICKNVFYTTTKNSLITNQYSESA